MQASGDESALGEAGRLMIPVTDLKQWAYCPRIVYYHRTMPGVGKPTYKMTEALRAQEMIERLESRRQLREYGFENARRRFGLWLRDYRLGLNGKLDLLLEREDAAAVVEFKLTSGEPGENHRLQIGGYALLVEGALGQTVRHGFVFRIPDNRLFRIEVDGQLRNRVMAALDAIREVAETQTFPVRTAVAARCVDCEYANYCGDVW